MFFQTYGFEHVYKTLSPLETAGLLRPQTSRSYNVLRKSLKLVVEDVQEQVNSDVLCVLLGEGGMTTTLYSIINSTTGTHCSVAFI